MLCVWKIGTCKKSSAFSPGSKWEGQKAFKGIVHGGGGTGRRRAAPLHTRPFLPTGAPAPWPRPSRLPSAGDGGRTLVVPWVLAGPRQGGRGHGPFFATLRWPGLFWEQTSEESPQTAAGNLGMTSTDLLENHQNNSSGCPCFFFRRQRC